MSVSFRENTLTNSLPHCPTESVACCTELHCSVQITGHWAALYWYKSQDTVSYIAVYKVIVRQSLSLWQVVVGCRCAMHHLRVDRVQRLWREPDVVGIKRHSPATPPCQGTPGLGSPPKRHVPCVHAVAWTVRTADAAMSGPVTALSPAHQWRAVDCGVDRNYLFQLLHHSSSKRCRRGSSPADAHVTCCLLHHHWQHTTCLKWASNGVPDRWLVLK